MTKPTTPTNDPLGGQTVNSEAALKKKVADLVTLIEKKESLPADADPLLVFAAKTEARRRHTQGQYTKAQQALNKIEAQKEGAGLTQDQIKELEHLKSTDPEAWYHKRRELTEQVENTWEKKAQELGAKARREELEALLETSGDLTMQNLENDVPARLLNEFNAGNITSEDLVEQATQYIQNGVSLPQPEDTLSQPDLGTVPGGSEPSKDGANSSENYEDITY